MNHDNTTSATEAMADRLALAICGHRIDQLPARLTGRDDYLYTAIDEAVMELEIIDQTITTAITGRRDQLNAELNQLEALEQALAAGQPVAPRRTTSLGEAAEQAVAEREAAIAGLCEQLYFARHALADPQ